jgi:hypothetical protein
MGKQEGEQDTNRIPVANKEEWLSLSLSVSWNRNKTFIGNMAEELIATLKQTSLSHYCFNLGK